MTTRALGTTGIELSTIGLGGFELGDDSAWEGAGSILTAAVESGTNWIDTAEAYSNTKNEDVIAAALRSTGVDLLVSTKVAPSPDGSGFEPEHVRSACEHSLRRLGIAVIDMYLLHWPDDTGVPLEHTWGAMRALVDDGLTRTVGLSNFTIDEIERCLAVGPVDLVQEGLSPIDHLDTRDLARWCAGRGIGVVTYEPLGNGMLAGAINDPTDFARVVDDYEEWGFWKRLFAPGKFERSQAVADGMAEIANGLGCTLAQLALAWNVQQAGVTSTLAGSRNPVHVRENGQAAHVVLTRDVLAQIDVLVQQGPLFD